RDCRSRRLLAPQWPARTTISRRRAALGTGMPEGDTLYRTAAGLRPHLLGRPVVAASARQPGPRAEMLVGATVTLVESRGKHLLIGFDSGLELRTHLGMHGSWHRYAPGEREPGEPGFSADRRPALGS
ncbi:MAG TPA: DNA-formamidopyrimidine glycosylase family protein, partial [Candidatus Limnocylindrales bacterium]